jgi:hypothetical protein
MFRSRCMRSQKHWQSWITADHMAFALLPSHGRTGGNQRIGNWRRPSVYEFGVDSVSGSVIFGVNSLVA